MSISKKTELVIDHRFNSKSCRHSLNGVVHVLHCHHFLALYTQLADDIGMLDGKALLANVTEDVFTKMLSEYYANNCIDSIEDRLNIACQMYSEAGLGKMVIDCAGPESGEISLPVSHVDEGWIRKWGKRDKPVNFVSQGFISGVFSAVFDLPARSYKCMETESVVSGAAVSLFEVTRV